MPADYKSGPIPVRKASVSDFPALEKMLARAFDDDPMANWVSLQDRHRVERITGYNSLGLHLALPFGEIYTTDDRTGVAEWIPPGETGSVFTTLRKGIRVTGMKHGILALIVATAVDKRRPKTPIWELIGLGVEPSLHGRGIGCALLQPVLNRCDRDHTPAYLTTAKERNVRFYEHGGFHVMERLKLPCGAPDLWIMWREPRSLPS